MIIFSEDIFYGFVADASEWAKSKTTTLSSCIDEHYSDNISSYIQPSQKNQNEREKDTEAMREG